MNEIKNALHNALQGLYSLRNFIIDAPVWLTYTNQDLVYKSQKYIDFVKPKSGCKVIDLGCGNGIMLHPYLKITTPENIYGVDRMITNIMQARSKFPNCNFSVGDISEIDGKYDVIVIHGVIGYFEYDKQKILLEKMFSSLHKNGTIILGAINFTTDEYIFQTYPFHNLKHIKKLCRKYNLKYELRPDSDFDKTGKYNAWTLFIHLRTIKPPIYISPSRLCRGAEYNKGGLSVTK